LVENAAAEVLDPLGNADEHGRLVYQHEANGRVASVSECFLKVCKIQFGHLRACDDVTSQKMARFICSSQCFICSSQCHSTRRMKHLELLVQLSHGCVDVA
jgi:hypothetical protein